MKSSIVAFLLAVSALVGLAPNSGAAPATPFDLFFTAVLKRTANNAAKSGYCMCQGGDFDRGTGVILALPDEVDGLTVVNVACVFTTFDQATGGPHFEGACDEGWTPLPR